MKKIASLALCLILIMSMGSAVSAGENRAVWPWQRTEEQTQEEPAPEALAETEPEEKPAIWPWARTEEEPSSPAPEETSYSELADGTLQLDRAAATGETAQTFRVPDHVDGKTVSAIGPWAFSYAEIEEVYLPYTVETIDEKAFAGSRIRSFKASPDSPFAVIDGVLFEKKTKALVSYPAAREDTGYTVPDGILEIRAFAFYQAGSLENIDIPDTVKAIGRNAFTDCVSLQRVAIPQNVKLLEACTFTNCQNLREAVLPEGLEGIQWNAFYACSSLESLAIPASVKAIGSDVFYGCDRLLLKVERNTAAAEYARDNNLEYEYPDPLAWLTETEEETKEEPAGTSAPEPETKEPETQEPETQEPDTEPSNLFDVTTVTPGVLTVATSADFPPYEYWAEDEEGNEYLAGFDIALAEYIADYLGLELRFTTTDFEGVFIKIQVGSADIGIAGISETPDRARLMDFSGIYYSDAQTFVCRAEDAAKYSSLDDINRSGLKIGVQAGSLQEDIADTYSPNADISRYVSFADGLRLLLTGEIDGLYVDTEIAENYLARRYADELAVVLDIPNTYSEGTSVCVAKDNQALLSGVNEAVQAAIGDGSMSEFIAREIALAAGEDVTTEEAWNAWKEKYAGHSEN